MNRSRRSSRRWVLALALLPAAAGAQAWTAEKGSMSFTLGYTNNWNTKHYRIDGSEFDGGHTRSQVMFFGVSLALTDRLTISSALPYVQARYKGANPHPGTIDNGKYHGTVQDLRLELRYQTLESPVALTPFLSRGRPTHEYTTLGHAAPGKGNDEYGVGFYAGASLDPWIPNTYTQLRYAYSFVEKAGPISHDRSNADLEIGHFLTSSLGLRALVSWQDTYGGLTLPLPGGTANPLYRYHDKAGASDYLNLGLGLSYSITHMTDVFVVYARSVSGRNGHKLDDGLTFGVSLGCHCAFRQVGERIPQIRSHTP